MSAGTLPWAVAVNPVTNKIYVANYYSANVTVIDGATNTTTLVAAGTYPYAVAVNPVTNKIYVANGSSNTVTVIDGSTNGTVTVASGILPLSVAVNPVTNKIYVANGNSDNVTVIDGSTNGTVTVAVANYSSPHAVAVNPVTNKIYVGGYGAVTVIDGATNDTATVASGGFAVAVNPVTNKIYAANVGGNSVAVIDGASNQVDTTVGAGTAPFAVAVNPVTNKIYVANSQSSNVTVIDGATNGTTTVAAGTAPQAVAVNPVTNKIYVSNANSDNVTVIDGATNGTVTVAAGSGPQLVAVNPVTNKIYVSNWTGHSVTVIDGATNGTVTVEAAGQPFAVAVNPVTNKIYVANVGGNNVTVIDGATNDTTTVRTGAGDCYAVAVNPVTNKVYVTVISGNNVTVITDAPNNDVKVVAAMGPSVGNVTPLARPTVTGKAVSRFTPYGSKMYQAFQKLGTSQMRWDSAATTAGRGSDSLTWSWVWGADSLIQGENFLCVMPLDSGTGSTNNLGQGTPSTGSLLVWPMYRLALTTDVGCSRILVPSGSVDSGTVVTPACSVYNYGTTTAASYAVRMKVGTYNQTATVTSHAAGTAKYVTFPAWMASPSGTFAVTCSTEMAGDQNRANDKATGSVTVNRVGGPGVGWTAKSPMLAGTKAIKDGGWLAYDAGSDAGTGLIYASRGNKQPDFFSYNPAKDSWKALAPWLSGIEGKLPQKGSAGCADGSGHIYATKGNNTRGFWLYDATANSWTQRKDVPLGLSNKKVKGGTDIVWAYKSGVGYAYLLKGYKNEFYRYHTDGDTWHVLTPAPGAIVKWDKGSWLAYDGANTIYAHKAKFHEFYKYDTERDSWNPTALVAMPVAGSAGSKKSKDGGCGASFGTGVPPYGLVYALKGGNTREFWLYTVATNSWAEKETIPTGAFKKKVKSGADVVAVNSVLYATKGNKTNEFWMYIPSGSVYAAPRRDGVVAERLAIGNWRMAISPNPIVSGFVHLAVGGTSLSRPALVRLYDVTGRCVGVWKPLLHNGAADLDVRHLPAGVYLVKLTTDAFAASQKLVVQR